MRTLTNLTAMLFLTLLALNVARPASAQSVTINRDDGSIARFLQKRGFRDVVITKRKFTSTEAEGCKGNDKFRLKVNLLGEISRQKRIGSCGRRFGAEQAIKIMERDGYKDVKAAPKGDTVIATGCRENRAYQLTFNLRGDLIDRARGRRCGRGGMSTKQVRAVLRQQGYDRIRFTDKDLPKYEAEACNQNTKVRLELNRRGEIRTERRIGVCKDAIDARKLAEAVTEQGYRRVEVIQDRRAPYLARGCKRNDRFELIVSRYGDVTNETKIGKCRKPIDPDSLASLLKKEGYERVSRIRTDRVPYSAEACKNADLVELTIGRLGRIRSEKVVGRCAATASKEDIVAILQKKGLTLPTVEKSNRGGWVAQACQGSRKVEVRLTRFGELRDQRNIGSCDSEKVLDVLENLRQRGAKNVTMFVQGCFQNNTYHWIFDDLGNRVDRRLAKSGC